MSSSAVEAVAVSSRLLGRLPRREYSADMLPTIVIDPAVEKLNRVPLNGSTTERFDLSLTTTIMVSPSKTCPSLLSVSSENSGNKDRARAQRLSANHPPNHFRIEGLI